MRLIRAVIMTLVVLSGSLEIFGDELEEERAELRLLQREDVLKELGVPYAQQREMRRSVSSPEFRDKLRKLEAEAPTSREFLADATHERLAVMKLVLEPSQLQRLEELRWRYNALDEFGATLGSALNLSADQKRLIAEKETELGKELQESLRAIYRKSQLEFQELMTPEQRANWHSKVGETFEFDPIWLRLTALSSLH